MKPSLALALLLAACGGAPKTDPRIPQLEQELANTKDALAKQKAEAEALRGSEAELKAKADEANALQAKLAEAVGKFGEVTTADGAVRLEMVDQILFPVGEADLSESGKQLLAKVGAALKGVDDKQIWVQGHTDDQPIIVRKPKPEPPPKPEPVKVKKGKDGKPVKADPKAKAPPPKTKPKPEPEQDSMFAYTTNWELSAARALTVVHYLQDEAKLDPTRLAAVAFGEFRPISKNKAKNRRIEIVLYPRAKISPK